LSREHLQQKFCHIKTEGSFAPAAFTESKHTSTQFANLPSGAKLSALKPPFSPVRR